MRRSLALLVLLLLVPSLLAWFGPGGCSLRPRVLVVGIDGGNWQLMDPLMRAGYLPNLARVVDSGARAGLTCTEALPILACYCPPVWNTIVTGQSGFVHGITSISEPSTDRRVKAFWDVLHDYGGTSTVLAMRNTWPAEPDIDFSFTEEGLDVASTEIYDRWGNPLDPRAYFEQVATQPPGMFEELGMLPFTGERVPVWEMLARDRVSMEALRRMLRFARTDFTFIVLHGPDKAEHLLWDSFQHVQGGPFDEAALLDTASRYDGPVVGPAPWSFGTLTAPYQEADAWLGRLLRRVDFDYIVLVSDHGMGRSSQPGLAGQHSNANPEAHVGIFAIAGPGIRRADLGTVSVFDVAPTLAYVFGIPVGADLPGRVLEEAFWPGWLDHWPVQHVASWQLPRPADWKPSGWPHREQR